MKICIPSILHSHEGRIKQKKLFISPISKCRREVGPQVRGTPTRIILSQYFKEPRGIRDTGTCPYPFSPHRLLLSPTTTAPSSVNGLLSPRFPYSSLQLSPFFSYERNHSSEKQGTRGWGKHLKGYKVFGHNTDQNAFFPWCFQPKDYFWLN